MTATTLSLLPRDASDDLLKMDHINSLPQPFLIRMYGCQIRWPLESIDVQTGTLRFDVCGKLQVSCIGEVAEFIDADGVSHDPDEFYEEDSAQPLPAPPLAILPPTPAAGDAK